MKVIDSHTHYFPVEIFQDVKQWAHNHNEPYFAKLMSHTPNLESIKSPEDMLKDMDKANVNKAMILGWYWQNQKTCDLMNGEVAKLLKKYPDRFLALASIKEPLQDLDKILQMGFLGFGELHDKIQDISFESDFFIGLLEFANNHKLIINFHLSDNYGKEYFGKEATNNDKIIEVAKKYKGIKFILSHWGGGEILYDDDYKRQIKDSENIYLDTSASPLLYPKEIWAKVMKDIPNKCLYGSDYPLRVYPKKQKTANFEDMLDEAIGSLNEQDCKKILFDNFKNLQM